LVARVDGRLHGEARAIGAGGGSYSGSRGGAQTNRAGPHP
jgi:hypothetical protein